jgi:hypothetical protein
VALTDEGKFDKSRALRKKGRERSIDQGHRETCRSCVRNAYASRYAVAT